MSEQWRIWGDGLRVDIRSRHNRLVAVGVLQKDAERIIVDHTAAAELAAARSEVERLTAERDAWRELADNLLGPWTQLLVDDPYNQRWMERFGMAVVYSEWRTEFDRLMVLSTPPATARPGQEGSER